MKPDGITERHVQALWYDRELRPDVLYTRTGTRVRVVHPGEWNGEEGPDFRGAVLEVGDDRRRLAGDVEVHLSPRDWTAHGHGTDPRYRNVIAHVTWRCGERPATLPSAAVSIWLGRFLETDVGFSPERIDLGAYPFGRLPISERPCRNGVGGNPSRALEVLAGSGRWRLGAKAQKMALAFCRYDRREVFYREVMNALGYGRNGAAFRNVAERVPYSAVLAEPENASAAFEVASRFCEWDYSRVRPNNSPKRRLAAAARLFTETAVMRLAETDDFSRGACRMMLETISAGGLVGRGRAAAIIANVVAPFALASGRLREVPDWLPPEDVSAPVRRVAYRMFGGDHNPRRWYAANGLLIQGLIQIDCEYCSHFHPECGECRVDAIRCCGNTLG